MTKPLFNRVFIKTLKESDKTVGGIYKPTSAVEKPSKGIIVATGEEVKYVKVGQTAHFNKWSGQELNLIAEEVLVLKEEDIIAVGE